MLLRRRIRMRTIAWTTESAWLRYTLTTACSGKGDDKLRLFGSTLIFVHFRRAWSCQTICNFSSCVWLLGHRTYVFSSCFCVAHRHTFRAIALVPDLITPLPIGPHRAYATRMCLVMGKCSTIWRCQSCQKCAVWAARVKSIKMVRGMGRGVALGENAYAPNTICIRFGCKVNMDNEVDACLSAAAVRCENRVGIRKCRMSDVGDNSHRSRRRKRRSARSDYRCIAMFPKTYTWRTGRHVPANIYCSTMFEVGTTSAHSLNCTTQVYYLAVKYTDGRRECFRNATTDHNQIHEILQRHTRTRISNDK